MSPDQATAEAGSGFGRVANRLNVEGISSSPLLLPTSFSGKIWINKNTGQVACCSPWHLTKLSSLCDPRGGWLVIFFAQRYTVNTLNFHFWKDVHLKQNYKLNLDITSPSFSALVAQPKWPQDLLLEWHGFPFKMLIRRSSKHFSQRKCAIVKRYILLWPKFPSPTTF